MTSSVNQNVGRPGFGSGKGGGGGKGMRMDRKGRKQKAMGEACMAYPDLLQAKL